MQKVKEQLIPGKDDYEIIMAYLKGGINRDTFDRHGVEALEADN